MLPTELMVNIYVISVQIPPAPELGSHYAKKEIKTQPSTQPVTTKFCDFSFAYQIVVKSLILCDRLYK